MRWQTEAVPSNAHDFPDWKYEMQKMLRADIVYYRLAMLNWIDKKVFEQRLDALIKRRWKKGMGFFLIYLLQFLREQPLMRMHPDETDLITKRLEELYELKRANVKTIDGQTKRVC
jgi:hypothetical protein